MPNEVGTTLLNSLTNSSFDIGNMSTVLAEAEVAGPRSILATQEEKTNTELNALTYLQTNVLAFKTYLTDLSNPDTYNQSTATSGNDSIFSVSVTGSPVNSSYQVESRQLAQAHTLVSNKVFSSMSDTVSSGTLSLTVGGSTKDITVDASNNTLEGLQRVINNGDYGVNASIINNGSGYQMMFTSKNTGAANEVSVSGLADFDTDGLTTTSYAQDAIMVLNGLAVTSTTNTFDNVIDGLSIQLKSASSSSQSSLQVGQDTQGIVDTVSSFVDVYNQLDTILDELGSYEELTSDQLEDPDFEYFGDLAGSSLLRELRSQLKSSLSGAIDELSEPYNSLAVVGVSFDREGVMQLDESQLNSIVTADLDAIAKLFSKGGSSDDPLVNVIGGNENTETGNYSLEVTQLAERASVTGGAVIYAANEYRLGASRVLDPQASLTLDAGAQFDLTINGTTETVALTAGTYADKDAVAAEMQAQINTAFTASGYTASVAFDIADGRFEFTTANGTISAANAANLTNQGLSNVAYTGDQLIDMSGADATFDVVVDGSTSVNASLQAGKYTLDELANKLRTTVNGLSEVQALGAEISVSTDGGALGISSNRFGANSSLTLSNFTNFANGGLTADLTDTGQNVDGTITTALGTLNIGAYADTNDGRKVTVSDFAVIGGEAAEVRGLSFEVLGGLTGARGSVTFAQGFASRMEETISNLLEDDEGLVLQRMDSLNSKLDDYEEKTEKIDARYETLLLRYQLQFSALQTILSSSEQTRDYLTATFNSDS